MGKKITRKECEEAAKKYTSRKKFKKENDSVYNCMRRNGWIDEICLHMEDDIMKGYTLEHF